MAHYQTSDEAEVPSSNPLHTSKEVLPPQEAKNQNKKTKSTTQSAWWSYKKEEKNIS